MYPALPHRPIAAFVVIGFASEALRKIVFPVISLPMMSSSCAANFSRADVDRT